MEKLEIQHIQLNKECLDYVKQLKDELLNINETLLNMNTYITYNAMKNNITACWLGWHYVNNNPRYVEGVDIFTCCELTTSTCVSGYFNGRIAECANINDDITLDLLTTSMYNFLFHCSHEANKRKCEARALYVLEHKAVPVVTSNVTYEVFAELEKKVYDKLITI